MAGRIWMPEDLKSTSVLLELLLRTDDNLPVTN
jgi:hypothetical protein